MDLCFWVGGRGWGWLWGGKLVGEKSGGEKGREDMGLRNELENGMMFLCSCSWRTANVTPCVDITVVVLIRYLTLTPRPWGG